MTDRLVERKRLMRLVTVQEQRYRNNRQVGRYQYEYGISPPRKSCHSYMDNELMNRSVLNL